MAIVSKCPKYPTMVAGIRSIDAFVVAPNMTGSQLSPPRDPAVVSPSPARTRLWLLLKGALYLVVLAALIHALRGLLPNPTSSAVIGAVLVSLAAARMGMDPGDDAMPYRTMFRATFAPVLIASAALLATVATGANTTLRTPGVSLLFTFVEVAAIAYRNELWLRGMPLYIARRAGVDHRWATAYTVLLAVGAVLLMRGSGWQGLVLVASSGLFFALQWQRGSHRWTVVAAHAAWLLLADGLLAGEVLRVGKQAGRIGGGASATGPFAWVASLGFLVAAAMTWRARWQPRKAAAQADVVAPAAAHLPPHEVDALP